MVSLWCTSKEAIDKEKAKNPLIGFLPCKESACDQYRSEYPHCVLMVRCGKYGWGDGQEHTRAAMAGEPGNLPDCPENRLRISTLVG
jgi:hypothetical protein